MQEDRRNNNLWAMLITLLLTVGTLVLLLRTSLHYIYEPDRQDLALVQDSIMFVGEEFVMFGDNTDELMDEASQQDATHESEAPDEEDNPDIAADDPTDAGEVAQTTPQKVTQKTESPQKEKKEEVKTGPTKLNDKSKNKPEAQKTNAEDQKAKTRKTDTQTQQTTNNATSNRVQGAFNSSGKGNAGSPNGNSTQGSLAGAPGINGLVGYTWANWARPNPNSKWNGSVTVRVTVDPRGKIIQAAAISAKGDIASHPEMRKACEQAALKSSFSVPKNTMTQATGTVIYTWK